MRAANEESRPDSGITKWEKERVGDVLACDDLLLLLLLPLPLPLSLTLDGDGDGDLRRLLDRALAADLARFSVMVAWSRRRIGWWHYLTARYLGPARAPDDFLTTYDLSFGAHRTCF